MKTMRYLGKTPAIRVVAIASVISIFALTAISAASFIHASRTGANLEIGIQAAQDKLSKHEETLRDSLASILGIENLRVKEAKQVAVLASQHRGEEGGRYAVLRLYESYGKLPPVRGKDQFRARDVSPQVAANVASTVAQYTAKVYLYQNNLQRMKTTYAKELDEGWNGMWLKLAGFPKISLSAEKSRNGAPKLAFVSKDNTSPASEPSANPEQALAPRSP